MQLSCIGPATLSLCDVELLQTNMTVRGSCHFEKAFSFRMGLSCGWNRSSRRQVWSSPLPFLSAPALSLPLTTQNSLYENVNSNRKQQTLSFVYVSYKHRHRGWGEKVRETEWRREGGRERKIMCRMKIYPQKDTADYVENKKERCKFWYFEARSSRGTHQ